MDNYYYARQFSQVLKGTAVNIAKAGSSNRRIIRTTVDYIDNNPVDLVILGLTFYDRQESPLLSQYQDPWVSYNSQGMQAQFASSADFTSTVEHKLVDDYVKSRYKFDINEYYRDQLYLDLKMLASYLKEQGIKFCIFNTCDTHLYESLGPGFIPFTFIGNRFLEQQGVVCMEEDKDLPINARHHYGEDVIVLVKHIVDQLENV